MAGSRAGGHAKLSHFICMTASGAHCGCKQQSNHTTVGEHLQLLIPDAYAMSRHDEDMDKALRMLHNELDHERALRGKFEAEAQQNGGCSSAARTCLAAEGPCHALVCFAHMSRQTCSFLPALTIRPSIWAKVHQVCFWGMLDLMHSSSGRFT